MARRIDERSGHAKRALFHGLSHQGLHLFQVFRSWRAVHIAQNCLTDLGRPHVRSQINWRAIFLQALEISPEIVPVNFQVIRLYGGLKRSQREFVLWSNRAALPGNFRGDALGEFAQGPIVNQQCRF